MVRPRKNLEKFKNNGMIKRNFEGIWFTVVRRLILLHFPYRECDGIAGVGLNTAYSLAAESANSCPTIHTWDRIQAKVMRNCRERMKWLGKNSGKIVNKCESSFRETANCRVIAQKLNEIKKF